MIVELSKYKLVSDYEYKLEDGTTKYATITIVKKAPINHEITTWTNKLEYTAADIAEYEQGNRYAQIFTDILESKEDEDEVSYTSADVAVALEVIEAYYTEEYMTTGGSIDYSALPEGSFGWPVPNNFIVAYLFGNTPAYGSYHVGIDIWPGESTGKVDIVAARSGTISYIADIGYLDNGIKQSCNDSGWTSYGNVIEIDHGDGYKTRYAHLSTGTFNPKLKLGAEVVAGQYLAKMGSSGCSTGTHLHYEMLFDRVRIDPLSQYEVEPYNYKLPYGLRNNNAITMTQPYKVVFEI